MPPKFFKKKSYPTKTQKTNETIDYSKYKYLIIVESPSKCKKIEGYLGTDYCCIASKGHLRHIEGLKSIDTKKTFEPVFSIISEKRGHVEFMKTVISKFQKTNIILASDDDREGEAIAWHICQIFDLPIETTQRIIFHEVTKSAIIAAVKSPTLVNMNLVRAQHARQVLDIIVGYKISPFLWKYLFNNKENSLSAGRCQTPALRLVYDNEKEKISAIPEKKYKTTGNFFNKNIQFDLNHEFENENEVLEFLEKSKTHQYKLSLGSQKESKKSPPRPFHTSRLLQTASNVLHMSPKETMSLCQQLYQNGYITYMRTESSQYSKSYLDIVSKFILNEYKSEKYLGCIDKLENNDTSNPQEAIRVTNLETHHLNSENTRMSSLYRLIWKNSVESCMSEAIYNTYDISIDAPKNYKYEYMVEIPKFLGWKKLTEKSLDTGFQNLSSGLLLHFQSLLKSQNPINHNYIDSTVVIRNKHQYYTEASLINKLEELGIGRPSTFASIVETIQDREYVKKMNIEGDKIQCKEFRLDESQSIKESIKERIFGCEKGKIVIQPIGVLTLEFLVQHFETMFSYEYTKTMEEKLDVISSETNIDWSLICKECYNIIKELAKPITNIGKQTYEIEKDYIFAFDKFGPVIRHNIDAENTNYISVRKDIKIDLEKLKNKEYKLDDLIEKNTNGSIGKYQNEDLFIKNGKFGLYVEWGENRESIKNIKKDVNELTIEDIKTFLENKTDFAPNILRKLNDFMSVRKGKFGPYVYYKRPDMNKPEFLNIKKFPDGFFKCEEKTLIKWLCDTYNLPTP